MDHFDADELLREHLRRNPQVEYAALRDPQATADQHRLRELLGHLDAALIAEGMPSGARRRVESRLVADVLGSDEEITLIQQRARLASQIVPGGWMQGSPLGE